MRDSLTWDAILPTFATNGSSHGSCCTHTTTAIPLPSHEPVPVSTASTTADDPGGLLYTLQSAGIAAYTASFNLYPSSLTELLGGPTLAFPYSGCHYTLCPGQSGTTNSEAAPAAPTYQVPQAYLLATSTTTLSSIPLDGAGGGGGTTTPESQNQGPPPTPTVTSPEPDHDSQAGSTPPGTPTQNPGGGKPSHQPSDIPPTQPLIPSEGSPPDTPTQNTGGGMPYHPKPSDVSPTQPLTPSQGSPPGSPTQNPGDGMPSDHDSQAGFPPPGMSTQRPGGVIPSDRPSDVLPTEPLTRSIGQAPPPSTIGSSVVTPNSATQYIVGAQTLAPGSAIEVSGTTYSLPSESSQVMVQPAPTEPSDGTSGLLPTLTLGDSTLTANSASQHVVGGQTLAPGSDIVVSGTSISLTSGGSQLIVGTGSAGGGSPSTTTVTMDTGSGSSSGSGSGTDSSTSGTATPDNKASCGVGISLGKISMLLGVLLFWMT